MTKQPWMKFYPQDWRGDVSLRMCSLAARGAWIEICAIMHEAQPYGHLLVNGNAPTETQLAVMVGAPSDQLSTLIGELETAGVFSRTSQGVIYSRRMTRDDKKRRIALKNGAKGGNPTLGNNTVIPPLDNQTANPQDKPQKPNARVKPNGLTEGRGSRLPDNWVCPDDWIWWAQDRRRDLDAYLEAERFRNYWTAKSGKDAAKRNWERTWQNWILNATVKGNGNGSRRDGPSDIEIIADVARQLEGAHSRRMG